jgi:quercetin dioxygenase-like cupin family protein
VRAHALFDGDSPRPQFLMDSEKMKVIVAGLEAGQQIPHHPEALAVYYFLEGEGTMTVNGDEFPVAQGATVITPPVSARGMRAATRLVFLAVRAGA